MHLARESDLETVARTLNIFDSSPISADRLRECGPPPPEWMATITRAMADFGVIVQSLHKARSLVNVRVFSDLTMPIIFEKWADLVRWLTYMLAQASTDSRSNIAALCCELVRGATAAADEDPHREELAARDCTVDLIYLLLCQMDETGSYLYLPPRADRSYGILSLFREYFKVTSMRAAMDRRLHCRSQRISSTILKSLVGRTRKCVEMATNKSTVVGCIKNLSCILEGIGHFATDPALWKELHRQDFLREFTAALLALVEKGTSWQMAQDDFVWRAVGDCFFVVCHSSTFSPRSPRYAVLELMNAGLLSCMRICLSRIFTSHSIYAKNIRRIFINILPYLYTPQVHDATDDIYSPYDLRLQDYDGSYNWEGFDDLIRWGKTVQHAGPRRDNPIAMCSNLRVSHFMFP